MRESNEVISSQMHITEEHSSVSNNVVKKEVFHMTLLEKIFKVGLSN